VKIFTKFIQQNCSKNVVRNFFLFELATSSKMDPKPEKLSVAYIMARPFKSVNGRKFEILISKILKKKRIISERFPIKFSLYFQFTCCRRVVSV